MKLPSVSRIRQWMKSFDFQPGLDSRLLQAIRLVTSSFSVKDRDCILVWDEMSIKELIEYNKFRDKLEGIVDLGQNRRKLESANEVLVLMIQGINTKWKFPIGYFFSSNATQSVNLKAIVEETIERLYTECQLNVRLLVCDMAFTNQALYKDWNVNEEKPFHMFGTRKIYCVFDTPHLIKLVRNNLMKYEFQLKRRVGSKWIVEKIRWLHILNFFNKDRRLSLRMAPRLTRAHVFVKDFSKMKVKLATQLLSNSVYAGMMAMINLRVLKPEAKSTAKFIQQIDDMFDLLNISKFSEDKKTRNAKHFFKYFDRFDKHLRLLKILDIPKYPHKPEFVHGLKITLKGVKHLCQDLKSEGYTHVYTRQLQQDCLENLFSCIRMKGGFCRNPTARQFRINFKYIFLAKLVKNPRTSNAEATFDSVSIILDNLKDIRNADEVNDDKNMSKQNLDGLYKKGKRKLKLGNEQEQCVLTYFAPACIKKVEEKIKCQRCKEMLVAVDKVDDGLLGFKQESKGKALSICTDDELKIFQFLNQNFENFATNSLQSNGCNIMSGILELYTASRCVQNWLSGDCSEHKLEIIKYFIRSKLYRAIKDKNESVRKIKSWNQTRRELRNQ